MPRKYSVIAEPQPGPQAAFVECPIFEIFYGGARGGGKTMAVLIKWAAHCAESGALAKGLIVRRERTHLVDMIRDACRIYLPLGAKWKEQAKEMVMPNGAVLAFAYLESDKDAEAYQGHSYSFVGVEEITQFSDPAPLNKLRATLRINGIKNHFVSTGNPGGPGHHWVKARYIDPAPLGFKVIEEEFTNPWTGVKAIKQRVFIPSKIKDNKYTNNADYISSIQQTGSPQLVKAWLEGDWNIVEGAYFPEFGNQHIVRPHEIPAHWTRYRAMDWGSYRPFSVGWFAVSDGEVYPRGSLVVYREWYGWTGKPNEGLKMTADAVAQGILQREAEAERITFTAADPSIFKRDGGPSIAEVMAGQGVICMPADNTRITGWNEMRRRFNGEDGKPLIYIFSTCQHLIRTIPILQHDDHKPEDVDTDGEDHAADMLRYGIMARYGIANKPYVKPEGILVKDVFRVRPRSDRV